MRIFLAVWLGQTLSLVGTALTSFALGVWVYRSTGSVTLYSLISLFTVLPGILVAPFAGALVDRWNRRWILVSSDLGAGLITATFAALVHFDRLAVWHLYALLSISSILNAFQFPAFSAATTQLVDKKDLTRAAGLSQLTEGLALILGPFLAPLIEAQIGLFGVTQVDLCTLLLAMSILLFVRIPPPEISAAGQEGKGSLVREAAYGWEFIRNRPGLLGLLIFFMAVNVVLGFMHVLVPPLILEMSNAIVLGRVMAFSAMGLLVGSVVISIVGNVRRRVRGILSIIAAQGIALVIGGLQRQPVGVALLAFLFMCGAAVSLALSQSIWQTKVPVDVQGRVFAVRRMTAWASLPVSYLLAGPLSDRVFSPLLAQGGSLSHLLGPIFGVGPGRGIAFFLSLLGMMLSLTTFFGFRNSAVYHLEDDLPDAVSSPRETPTSDG